MLVILDMDVFLRFHDDGGCGGTFRRLLKMDDLTIVSLLEDLSGRRASREMCPWKGRPRWAPSKKENRLPFLFVCFVFSDFFRCGIFSFGSGDYVFWGVVMMMGFLSRWWWVIDVSDVFCGWWRMRRDVPTTFDDGRSHNCLSLGGPFREKSFSGDVSINRSTRVSAVWTKKGIKPEVGVNPVKNIPIGKAPLKLATPVQTPTIIRQARPGLLGLTGFSQVANFQTGIARNPKKRTDNCWGTFWWLLTMDALASFSLLEDLSGRRASRATCPWRGRPGWAPSEKKNIDVFVSVCVPLLSSVCSSL